MTLQEAINRLEYDRAMCGFNPMTGELAPMSEELRLSAEALDVALQILKPKVSIAVFDQEEIHHNCTVQVLTNSVTGETSVGWWKEKEGE